MKKNTASQTIGAQLVSATDGSAFTGSVTVYVTGDAGTQAVGSVGSGACTHEGNGYHTYAPAQAETNYDLIAFTFIGSGAVPATVQVFTSYPQTGDNYARLGAPAGASIAADIATVDTVVDAILDDTGTSGVIVVTNNDKTGYRLSSTGVDDIWDEATAGHVTAGTTAVALTDILADTADMQPKLGSPAGASLSADIATIDANVDAILVDTGTTLQADITAILADTADMQPKLGTPAGASISADIATIDANVDAILVDTAEIGAAGAGLSAIPWNAAWDAEVQSECTDALNAYDPPTNAEMEARTPTAAQLAYITSNAADGVPVTFSGGTTTTAVLALVDGSTASSTDDFYNGRILVFNSGTLDMQVTDITDYVGSTKTATITAVTTAVTSSHTANLK